MENIRKLRQAQEALTRSLAFSEKAANLFEECGFEHQAHDLHKWTGPIEELRDVLADL
jgi:hypothetical protein